MASIHPSPHSTEVHYTLSFMAYHLMQTKPSSVRIASHSLAMVQSVVRHLYSEPLLLFVDSAAIQTAIAHSLGVMVQVSDPEAKPADAVVLPFSLEEGVQPRGEQTVIVACYNALSYKSLLYPRSTQGTAFRKLARLKATYRVQPIGGLYSPRFVAWLVLATSVARWNSVQHFSLKERAMRHLIEYGPLWRLSYIVVANGQHTS